METREYFMRQAIALARRAGARGEVPVGCVIVRAGRVIARASNRREGGKNALYHAETLAIDKACRRLGGWRLWNCELYVTLEPCPMCAGAIVNARIPKVYFGARDEKNGAMGSALDLPKIKNAFPTQAEGGILEDECRGLLVNFFKGMRGKK